MTSKHTKSEKALVNDLKTIIQSLSIVVTRIESGSYSEVPKDETPAEKNVFKRHGSLNRKSHNTGSSKKDPLKRAASISSLKVSEKVEEKPTKDTDSETIAPSRPSIKDMRMKFEVRDDKVYKTANSEKSGSPENNITNEEIYVDVRSLKQRFEAENDAATKEKPIEEQRRKSVDSKRNSETLNGEEYEDKVKRILKYFQPSRH